MESSTALRVVQHSASLDEITSAWEALWLLDPESTPFQHPAWLVPWWHSFWQQDLRVYTLWRGPELLALLPLYVLPQEQACLLLLVGAGTSDYLDAIVSPACGDEALDELLRTALSAPGWSVAHLNQLRAESRLRTALARLPQASAYDGEACSTCAALPIAELPTKLRADVRYFRNAAIGHGRLVLVQARAEQLAETFALLVRFHTERWQQRGEPGVLADPQVLEHHAEALARLDAAGLLRLMRLELAGEVIAVLYSLIDPPGRTPRTQYFYLMGYAPAHSELRPGILLTALASEHAAAEGIARIDMLRGDETYKQFWRVEPRPTFGFAVLPEDA